MEDTPFSLIIDLHCPSDEIDERFVITNVYQLIKSFKPEHPKLVSTFKKLLEDEEHTDLIPVDAPISLKNVNFREFINQNEYVLQINLFKNKCENTVEFSKTKLRKSIERGTFGFDIDAIYYHELKSKFKSQPDKILILSAVNSTKGRYSLHYTLFEVLK